MITLLILIAVALWIQAGVSLYATIMSKQAYAKTVRAAAQVRSVFKQGGDAVEKPEPPTMPDRDISGIPDANVEASNLE